jgi:glycosyltransferase involved in cell wall biosynthesis
LPSYREGVPRSTLEAMSTGMAVITSDVPGCRETVEDGRNGLLVPVRDPAALADAMIRLVDDGPLVRRMGRNSRELVMARFEVSRINAQMLEAMGLSDSASGRASASSAEYARRSS